MRWKYLNTFSKDVWLSRRVLNQPRVVLDHLLQIVVGADVEVHFFGADEPFDRLGAGRRREATVVLIEHGSTDKRDDLADIERANLGFRTLVGDGLDVAERISGEVEKLFVGELDRKAKDRKLPGSVLKHQMHLNW